MFQIKLNGFLVAAVAALTLALPLGCERDPFRDPSPPAPRSTGEAPQSIGETVRDWRARESYQDSVEERLGVLDRSIDKLEDRAETLEGEKEAELQKIVGDFKTKRETIVGKLKEVKDANDARFAELRTEIDRMVVYLEKEVEKRVTEA